MTDFFAAAHKAQTVHGAAKRGAWTRTYRSWRYMRDRVRRDPDYAHVGICTRWDSYADFLTDMGEQPIGLTLDRIDSTSNYTPGNCRWATSIEQANNRTNNRHVLFQGETLTLSQWARKLGAKYKTLHNRLTIGWSVERTLSTPAP